MTRHEFVYFLNNRPEAFFHGYDTFINKGKYQWNLGKGKLYIFVADEGVWSINYIANLPWKEGQITHGIYGHEFSGKQTAMDFKGAQDLILNLAKQYE